LVNSADIVSRSAALLQHFVSSCTSNLLLWFALARSIRIQAKTGEIPMRSSASNKKHSLCRNATNIRLGGVLSVLLQMTAWFHYLTKNCTR
jgi:hypothetical protein